MQKRNNAIKFFLDPTSFTNFDCFSLSHNNLHEFGKFDATASNDAKDCFMLQLFHLARVINFLNQFVRLNPERMKNLNLLDSN